MAQWVQITGRGGAWEGLARPDIDPIQALPPPPVLKSDLLP